MEDGMAVVHYEAERWRGDVAMTVAGPPVFFKGFDRDALHERIGEAVEEAIHKVLDRVGLCRIVMIRFGEDENQGPATV